MSEALMQISYMQSLCGFNTFGIDVRADLLCKLGTCAELKKATKFARQRGLRLMILGGGSNVLLTRDFHGVVILLEGFIDICICDLGARKKLVRAGAGIHWDSFVQFCVDEGLQGLELLAGIPGTVGASPIQNIGAYGSEVGDCLAGVEVFDKEVGGRYWLPCTVLELAYRDSVFKSLGSHLVILSVLFLLRKGMVSTEVDPKIREELGPCPHGLTLPVIAAAVRRVRDRRLPQTCVKGNAGSFFVNPVISAERMAWMNACYSEFPAVKQPDGSWKLSAGWLIQQCVAIGFRVNNVGICEYNPLVVVNHGMATGAEIIEFGQLLCHLVFAKFHIELIREPVLIN